jgi:hypothetical protein
LSSGQVLRRRGAGPTKVITVVATAIALGSAGCGGGSDDEAVAELEIRVDELETEVSDLRAQIEASDNETPDAQPTEPTATTIVETTSTVSSPEPTTLETTSSAQSEDTGSGSAEPPTGSYLQGTLQAPLPPGEPDEVSVIGVGPMGSSTPVVVRNNTSDPVTVHLSATARDPSGELVGSGEDQGLQPPQVAPGEIAIGYVFLGIDNPPRGTTIDVTARGDEVDEEFGGLPATITEHNLVDGEFGQQVVGIARNDNDVRMEGPISVLLMCFDEAANPLTTFSGSADIDGLDPGQEGSFSVDLFGDAPCSQYLVGASGYPF